jgi:hypothetical protein
MDEALPSRLRIRLDETRLDWRSKDGLGDPGRHSAAVPLVGHRQ